MLSAFSFGVSDFVGCIASRRAPALRVVLVSYPVAMVLREKVHRLQWSAWRWR